MGFDMASLSVQSGPSSATCTATTAIMPVSDQVAHERGAHPSAASTAERSPLMFDPWLTTKLKLVAAMADNLVAAYASLPRQRRMKDRDRQHLHLILRTILANLAYAVAAGADPLSVGFSLRTAKQRLTRYDRKGFTRLPEILETFPDHGGPWTLRKSDRKGIASAISRPRCWLTTCGAFGSTPIPSPKRHRGGRQSISVVLSGTTWRIRKRLTGLIIPTLSRLSAIGRRWSGSTPFSRRLT